MKQLLKKLIDRKQRMGSLRKRDLIFTGSKRLFVGNTFSPLGIIAVCLFVLLLTIRGLVGGPTEENMNDAAWKDNGPLELSPERGRYSLLYSVIENNSLEFTPEIASFTTPDVAYLNGKYVSLFAPGVSYMVIPGYLLGKIVGLQQVGTFAVVALFAALNVLLVRTIAIRLGAQALAATIGAFTFLFATPAFTYAGTLYQHHISTFLILLSLYLLLKSRSVFTLLVIWFLCAASIAIDYPNLFMMLPIGIFALTRVFLVESTEQTVRLKVPFIRVLSLSIMAIPLGLFLLFNYASYGNPMQLSGNIERALAVREDGSPVLEREEYLRKNRITKEQAEAQKNTALAFRTRNLINGFYIHFLSPDRGMLMFTPVMYFGFLGLFVAIKRKVTVIAVITGVIGMNILLYSLWADPYGGWAFGSRYLIPSYALLAICICLLISFFRKQIALLMLFYGLVLYSVSVNTLGAVTTNRNPPQVEIAGLEQQTKHEEKYTYARNMEFLLENQSKSFMYQAVAKNYITALQYYAVILTFLFGLFTYLVTRFRNLKQEVTA